MAQANTNKLVAVVFEVFKPTIIESDLPDEVEREITKAIEHEQMPST